MKINECFKSLQGEGPDVGLPVVFVRLSGCNVRCSFCDTQYAFAEGTQYSIEEVAAKVCSLAPKGLVIVTGGEPLLQQDELGKLVQLLRKTHHFAVETNGTLPKPRWWNKVLWDVDCKCPSSGVTKFDNEWFSVGEKNRIKFVVSNINDLFYVAAVVRRARFWELCPTLLVSPMIPFTDIDNLVAGRDWLQQVWHFCVVNDLRFSLQIHKVVFGSERGV